MKEMLKTRGKRMLWAFALLTALIIALPAAAQAAGDAPIITVTQVFITSDATAEATFSYLLKPLEADNPLPAAAGAASYAFTLSGNSSLEIGPLHYSRPGVYRYEIFQEIGVEKDGYAYDKRVYTVEAYVDEFLDLIFIVLNADGAKAQNIVFTNRYNVEPEVPEEPPLPSDPTLMVDPPVRKTVAGNPGVDGVFTFKLTAGHASYPMPEGSVDGVKTLYIKGSGMGEFGTWSYDKAGAYFYTVSEVNTAEKGYTYDTALYTITDVVTAVDGQLTVARVVTNALNKQVTSLTFINKYSQENGGKNGGPEGGGAGRVIPDGPRPNGGVQGIDEPLNSIDADGTPFGNWLGLPKTGDNSNAALYLILLAVGAALVIAALVYLTVSRQRRKATI